MSEPWWKNSPDGYEVIDPIRDDVQEATISASFTPNNGIRLQIINDDLGDDWACFDLEPALAARIGEALMRWADRHRFSGSPPPT